MGNGEGGSRGKTPVDISINDHDGNTKSSLQKLVDDRKIDVMVNIDEERGKCGLPGSAEPIQTLYMIMQPSTG